MVQMSFISDWVESLWCQFRRVQVNGEFDLTISKVLRQLEKELGGGER